MTPTQESSTPASESQLPLTDIESAEIPVTSTATMGFFHKYQKPILYGAGIFALLSFSIGGAMISVAQGFFARDVDRPSITVKGQTVKLTQEDFDAARMVKLLIDNPRSPVTILPELRADRDANADLINVLALLRRAAIENGIEASSSEVDRAIAQGVKVGKLVDPALDSPTTVALRAGYSSLDDYKRVLTEAMRISTFVRYQAITGDEFDSAIVDEQLAKAEWLKVRVAVLDKEKIEEAFKQTEITDEDLETWVKGLEEGEQAGFGFIDTDRAQIKIAKLDPATFDPTQWTEELKDKEYGEDQLKTFYDQQMFVIYTVEKKEDPKDSKDPKKKDDANVPQDNKPFDEVKDDVKKRLQARDVMLSVWSKVQKAQFAGLQALTDARIAADRSRVDANKARDEAKLKSDEKKDDAALKTAFEAAEAAAKAAETSYETADKAVDAARSAFDLEAAMKDLTAGKTGFSFIDSGEKPLNNTDLGEIEGIGAWANSWAATSLQKTGQLSSQVQFSKDAVFEFMALGLEKSPLKAFADIKDDARKSYYEKQADEKAKTVGEEFEAKILELAKAAVKTKVDELEASRKAKLDEGMKSWRDGIDKKLGEWRSKAESATGSRAKKALQEYIKTLETELAGEVDKRANLKREINAEIDTEIEDEAKTVYKDVLEAAAKAAGLEVVSYGPYDRSISSSGAKRETFPKAVRFLFFGSKLNEIEPGEATEFFDDATDRAKYMAVCDEVVHPTVNDISRRQLLSWRQAAERSRPTEAITQSFGLDALKKRYKWSEKGTGEIKAAPPEEKGN